MTKFGIGQAVRRVEDQRFLTGTGSFVSDLVMPRQCYGAAVLSPHVAVLDALRPVGVADLDMSLTLVRVWQAIQATKPSAAA